MVTVFAHRGYAGRFPENTLRAIRGAAATADWVELDAMPTADGTPVVFHDERLDRKTDRSGVVWERPTGAVCGAEVLASGERVPTLAAALEAAATAGLAVNLELKNPGSFDVRPGERLTGAALAAARERWAGFVDRTLAVLDAHDVPVWCSSFCTAPLALAREAGYDTAVIATGDVRAALATARDHDAAAIHPPVATIPGALFDPDRVATGGEADGEPVDVLAAAADAGLAVNPWTVRTWYEADRLVAAGVDGLIADYPSLPSGTASGRPHG